MRHQLIALSTLMEGRLAAALRTLIGCDLMFLKIQIFLESHICHNSKVGLLCLSSIALCSLYLLENIVDVFFVENTAISCRLDICTCVVMNPDNTRNA